MANVKITQLPSTATLDASDLIPVVTNINSTPLTSHITKENLAGALGSTNLVTNPVENSYADIAALLADQASQTEGFFQYVLDASADPNIATGAAYYEKLSTSTTVLSADYRLLSQSEQTTLESSQSYRTFDVESILDDTSSLISTSGGKIGFEYNTTSGAITGVLFNKIYSTAVDEFYGEDVNLTIYNRTTKKYERGVIKAVDWSTVNTDYYHGTILSASMLAADFNINDSIELDMSASTAVSGSGTVTSVTVVGTDGIEVDSGSPITTAGTITLGINAATLKALLAYTNNDVKSRLREDVNVNGTYNLDYSSYETWFLTLNGVTTFTESNLPTSGTYTKVITIHLTGDFALSFPTGWSDRINGSYDGSVDNTIVVEYIKTGEYKVSITQPD